MLTLADVLAKQPPTHLIKNNQKKRMQNRRMLEAVLHKILITILLTLEIEKIEELVCSETFLNCFIETAKIADATKEEMNRDIYSIIGVIMDIYEKCPWNPNKKMPIETATQVIEWFCVFVSSSFKKDDLTWNGKIGNKVIQELKIL